MKEFLSLSIRREEILNDSVAQIADLPPRSLHNRLNIIFVGEIGQDIGGISREWFQLVSQDLINPNFDLFITSENHIIKINPDSSSNRDHLRYFKFVGRFFGMAIFHKAFVEGGFDENFFKQIISKRSTMKDLEMSNPSIYQSLNWIIDNNIENEELELYFCADSVVLGSLVETELIPGGKNIKVTEANKIEYVDLIAEWFLEKTTFIQMQAIRTGFYEVIPYPWLAFFDEKELQYLLCGTRLYNIDDWKRNTIYSGGYSPKSPQCIWFWQFVEKSNERTRAKIMKFVTGSANIPFSGFGDLYCSTARYIFTIEKRNAPGYLPTAHTCFNRIDLPVYSSYEELETKLLLAIEETAGFYVG